MSFFLKNKISQANQSIKTTAQVLCQWKNIAVGVLEVTQLCESLAELYTVAEQGVGPKKQIIEKIQIYCQGLNPGPDIG